MEKENAGGAFFIEVGQSAPQSASKPESSASAGSSHVEEETEQSTAGSFFIDVGMDDAAAPPSKADAARLRMEERHRARVEEKVRYRHAFPLRAPSHCVPVAGEDSCEEGRRSTAR